MTLSTKERSKFAEAEGHIRAHFGDMVQCSWEVIKPKGAPRIAVLAGFIIYGDLLILQVYKDGAGWEVFAAPGRGEIAATFAEIDAMWTKP